MNRIDKLPKWAQRHIEGIEFRLGEAKREVKRLTEVHEALHDCASWFSVSNMQDDPFTLFILRKDAAQPLCALSPRDRLLVIRPKDEEASQ